MADYANSPVSNRVVTYRAALSDAFVVAYTVPKNKRAILRNLSIYNTDGSNAVVPTLSAVPNTAGAVDTTPATADTFYGVSVSAGAYVQIKDPGVVLTQENDTIQVKAATAAKLNIFMEIEEISA